MAMFWDFRRKRIELKTFPHDWQGRPEQLDTLLGDLTTSTVILSDTLRRIKVEQVCEFSPNSNYDGDDDGW